jgi:hypothetical protein
MAVSAKKNDPIAMGSRRKGAPARMAKLTTEQRNESAAVSTSKKALHLCLKRIKEAESKSEVRLLTEGLQRAVFHQQYQNAED